MLEKAMQAFWAKGYEGTSMADLVAATGSTRQSIYGDFASKHGLYRACFDFYRDQIVLPALEPFSESSSGLSALEAYFQIQISLAEAVGLPGPGCLVGNAMTESAPGDPDILQCVEDHNRRLEQAFARALPDTLEQGHRRELARFLVVAAQGLWAMSRVTPSADELRARAATIIRMVEREVHDAV